MALGLLIFMVPAWLVVTSFVHVFQSAKVAAQHTRELLISKRVSLAAMRYAEGHKGLLPGPDWRRQLEKIDPGLSPFLRKAGDDLAGGYAAVPGTMGKEVGKLPPETIVYVSYHEEQASDILPGSGDSDERGQALTAAQVMDGSARTTRLTDIIRQLRRQGVPGR